MNIVSARDGILPEVGEKLGKEAMKYLKKVGVNVITNTKATDASEDSITLDNGKKFHVLQLFGQEVSQLIL